MEYRPPQAPVIEPSRGFVRERVLTVEATAYCLKTPTFTGYKPHSGVIAVDPKVIPLYSRCYINGIGYVTALDTGKDIKNNRIDIWFSDYNSCVRFGRKQLQIKVLEE